MKSITREQIDQVLSDITMMQYRLGQMGMWETYQAMHEVTRLSGYEAAEIIVGDHPTKLTEEVVSI